MSDRAARSDEHSPFSFRHDYLSLRSPYRNISGARPMPFLAKGAAALAMQLRVIGWRKKWRRNLGDGAELE